MAIPLLETNAYLTDFGSAVTTDCSIAIDKT